MEACYVKAFRYRAAINRLKEGKYIRRVVPPRGFLLLPQSIFKLRSTGVWRKKSRRKWRKYGTLDSFKKEFKEDTFILCDVKGDFKCIKRKK